MIHTVSYELSDIAAYINWLYFFHAWKLKPSYASIAECTRDEIDTWAEQFAPNDKQAREAIKLYIDACSLIKKLSENGHTLARFGLFPARSKGDNIYILNEQGNEILIPFLRQQHPISQGPNLCISDFISPSRDFSNTLGLFAATVDSSLQITSAQDTYSELLVKTLCDRFAEATCERMHEEVRKKYWGYASNENLNKKDLFNERFQGIRPAVGYPSIPDQSINFIINEVLNISDIGISLTENGAMIPHASVCGFMISHPQSTYFSIGKIGEDQFVDYAQRRQLPPSIMRQFLAANL